MQLIQRSYLVFFNGLKVSERIEFRQCHYFGSRVQAKKQHVDQSIGMKERKNAEDDLLIIT